MKMKAEETQPVKENIMNEEQKKNLEALLEQCAAVDAEIKTPTQEQTKTAANGLVAKLAKTVEYLSAATAVGFIGYYAWKKFGSKAE